MLAESNAILCFLSEGCPLFPDNRWQRAQILQWLFFEQYSHEPNIATVRYWVRYLGKRDEWADKIRETMPRGYTALRVMEDALCKHPFIVGDAYTDRKSGVTGKSVSVRVDLGGRCRRKKKT